ncbi:energy-coupling factor transport system substrate-specific component [Nocardioides daedukensis]|uniref:Energy-coupling factor transport system substrate-specific component n=1 Tax=Nocardioides daedukensis TaxID=634462 RepID=A0A7Y9S2K8_9ACTN|nr:ECF transporter S component [Nocardioides daedukensis]NYG60151.1 energy-coupling factor transport system substrate-specific component [Nocardioides daedukensis]
METDPGGLPDGARTPVDGLVASLQEWRAAAGNPAYAEVAARVARARVARGIPEFEARVARTTIYDLFRLGRRRIDTDLLLEVVQALGVDAAGIERWQRAVEKLHRGGSDLSVPLVEPRPESSGEAAGQLTRDAAEASGGEPVPGPAGPTGPRLFLPGSQLLSPIVGMSAVALMVLCLVINQTGNLLTQLLPFVLYLDMIGTAIAAVLLGPWHGALVGLATSFTVIPQTGHEAAYFAVVNVAGALLWGYGVRSGRVRTIARYLLLCCLVGFVCTVLATIVILIVFEGGRSGHGSDNLVVALRDRGSSLVVAVFSTNLLASLVDKILSGLLALVAVDVLATRQRKRLDQSSAQGSDQH